MSGGQVRVAPRYGYARPEYEIKYKLEQIDDRTPLWYKQFYVIFCLFVAALGVVVGYGALDVHRNCQTTPSQTYLNANMYLGYVLMVLSVLGMVLALYFAIAWKKIWMHQVPIPVKKPVYGEDVEDIEPGYLSRSGARTFLDASEANEATKREVNLALNDLEKKQYGSRFYITDLPPDSNIAGAYNSGL